MDPAIFFDHPIFGLWLFIGKTAIWWFPAFAAYAFWSIYLSYIRANWIKNINWVLLEIKMPKEIFKSPKAMEVILSQLHQTSEGSLTDRYIKGRVRSWFSLELVSFGGEIHFYIRTEFKFRNLVESMIYSQYPTVEVTDADDYVYKVPYGLPNTDWDFYGVEFKLTKADAYPIKTYVDYGLDKDPKEEFKIDPFTAVLEFLGSIGAHEQVWVQIPIMAARDRYHKPGTLFGTQNWKDVGKQEAKKMLGDKNQFGAFSLSPGDREVLESIERSMNKYGFDTGYRAFYLAPKDFFTGTNIPRLLGSTKQYGSENLNGFKFSKTTSFDYPWEDFRGIRLNRMKQIMFKNYRRRNYFFPPNPSVPFILNTEELATIFHFPGLVAGTPTLGRIPSKRGEPPPNLPIE